MSIEVTEDAKHHADEDCTDFPFASTVLKVMVLFHQVRYFAVIIKQKASHQTQNRKVIILGYYLCLGFFHIRIHLKRKMEHGIQHRDQDIDTNPHFLYFVRRTHFRAVLSMEKSLSYSRVHWDSLLIVLDVEVDLADGPVELALDHEQGLAPLEHLHD